MNQNAKWIWKSKYCVNDYVTVGKDFDINDEIVSAKIQISAHNHYKLFVNNISVGGYVSPAPTVADKEKYFLEYDISSHLKKGLNHIEITALYLGGDGQNYVNAIPGIIADIEIETNQKKKCIYTDESWYYYESIPYQSGMAFQQNRRVTPIEYYDSRVNPIFSSKLKVVLSKMNDISPRLVLQGIHEGVVHEIICPKCIKKTNDIYVFDAGKIVSGFVRFKLSGIRDSIIKIRYSEDLLEDRVKHNVANESSDNYFDIFVMNDTISQSHQFDFTYKAFRYFEIEGYLGVIKENDIAVLHVGTDISYDGYIKSKKCTWINKLNNSVKNTQENNVIGQIVDCPHREQAQYLGDTYLQSHVLIQNTKNSIPVIKKALNDFSNMLHKDGTLPFVAPTNEEHEDFKLKIPEYNLYYILLVDRLLANDSNFKLKNYYASSLKILKYFIKKIDETGLVTKKEDWHIDDWPYPSTDNSGKYLTFENILVYISLKAFKKHTVILGEKFEYDGQMKLLYKNIRLILMSKGLFVDSYNSKKQHPGINAFALNSGMFNDSEVEKVLELLSKDNKESSIFLTYHVLEVLLKYGKVNAAISRILSPERGWIKMLEKDQTLWEGFDDIESHSHAWTGYPLALIQRYILGINDLDIINNSIKIKPQIISSIEDISTKVRTPLGWIEFSYEINDENIKFVYSLPEHLIAEFQYNDQKISLEKCGIMNMKFTRRN